MAAQIRVLVVDDHQVFAESVALTLEVEGYAKANGEEDPRARLRAASPGFFAALGVPIIAGRDFTEADRAGAERVVIVSQSLAQRMFPNQDALNRHLMWTDPVMKFIDVSTGPPGYISSTGGAKTIAAPSASAMATSRSRSRGYLDRSSLAPNCSGFTKMVTAVTSHSAAERWISEA